MNLIQTIITSALISAVITATAVGIVAADDTKLTIDLNKKQNAKIEVLKSRIDQLEVSLKK